MTKTLSQLIPGTLFQAPSGRQYIKSITLSGRNYDHYECLETGSFTIASLHEDLVVEEVVKKYIPSTHHYYEGRSELEVIFPKYLEGEVPKATLTILNSNSESTVELCPENCLDLSKSLKIFESIVVEEVL